MHVDVAVIGLGAMGSAALWRVAARGAGVVGIERFEPGHDKGSSHGDSRIIRSAYYEGPHYVPLVQSAFPLWRRLEQESSTALLTMTGALMIGPPDCDLVAGALSSARGHDLAHELLDGDQMRRRYPQFHLPPGEVALFEQQAGILRPEAAIGAMVRRAEALGATVLRQTIVEAVEADAGAVRISAGGRTFRARHAIVSVGSWLPDLLPVWRALLQVERQVMLWWPVRDPDLFSPQRFPVFMHEITPGRLRYGIPSLDAATVKIGVHHEGEVTTTDTIDRAVHPRDLAPVQRYLRAYCPDAEPVVARAKVCMYTNTPDHHFLIGTPPGLAGVTVLSVCSGHGFKYAPVVGDAAADLALEGRTSYPIDLFTPARFTAEGKHRRHLVPEPDRGSAALRQDPTARDEERSERHVLAGTVMDGLDPDDVWTTDGDVLRSKDNRSADRA
jgi:sarcosine oxidase